MTDISPELEAEAIEWEHWRAEVYACPGFNIEGPCCPLCRTRSDDPEHGRYWQILSEPGRFQGQRGIVQAAYDQCLNGSCGTHSEITTVDVPVAWRGPDRVAYRWKTVSFIERDDHNVQEVEPS